MLYRYQDIVSYLLKRSLNTSLCHSRSCTLVLSMCTQFKVRSFTRSKGMNCAPKLTRISYRWQTHTTYCITANVLQTNKVDAQCDKLATELSWQRFVSKVASFHLPHLHLTYPACIWRLCRGWPHLSCAEIFVVRKLKFLGEIVCVILRLAISIEHWLVTDGWTDRHTTTTNTRAIVLYWSLMVIPPTFLRPEQHTTDVWHPLHMLANGNLILIKSMLILSFLHF